MSVDVAVDLTQSALVTALHVAAPLLAAVFLAALAVNVLQTLTQLHDQTLNLVPRIVAGAVVVLALLPWVLGRLVEYTADLYENIPLNL
jgi:flagellar biosynthetic protein FliQ